MTKSEQSTSRELAPFGRAMAAQFLFDSSYKNMNHGMSVAVLIAVSKMLICDRVIRHISQANSSSAP